MNDNMKKSLDKKEGIQGFEKGKVEKYNLEIGAQACIDEVNLLLEFLEDDYLNKSSVLKEFRDHLTNMCLD